MLVDKRVFACQHDFLCRRNRSRQAEQVVLAQGGSVVRLAGLYTATRGPHSFWLEKTRSAGASDGVQAMQQRGSSASLVNMVHYEDAAAATIAAAKATGSFVYLPFCLMRPNGKISHTVAQSCAEVSSWPVTTSLSQERRSVGLLWLPGCTRGAPCQRYDSFILVVCYILC